MKKVFFVLAAAACMVACGNKAAESEAAAEDSVVVAEEVVEVHELPDAPQYVDTDTGEIKNEPVPESPVQDQAQDDDSDF